MLKGQAKKDYQREYMRDYMRNYRLIKRVVKTCQLRPSELAILDKAMKEKGKDRGSYAQYVQPNNQTIISCIDFMGRGKMQPELDPAQPNTTGIWDDEIDTSLYTKTQVKVKTTHYKVTELDADGNPIPEEYE